MAREAQRRLLCLALMFAFCATLSSAGRLEDIAIKVNRNSTALWRAEPPSKRFGSIEDVRTVCGARLKGSPGYREVHNIKPHVLDRFPLLNLPEDFDAKEHWPECRIMAVVRDQSACGSCWAFGSTEAFEDRRCVATNVSLEFSVEDTGGCCNGFACGSSKGCDGGQPTAALKWMTETGVVTGGGYQNIGSGHSCKPYLLAPCAHHVPATPGYPACPTKEGHLKCTRRCSEPSYPIAYKDDKYKGSSVVALKTIEGIMSSILTEGPVSATFQVYEDFPTYKSGVYHHVTGKLLGGHAVEITGWGTEGDVDFWLVKNSWNDQWGAGGFFKIRRGSNECQIEDDVAGIVFKT